MGAAQSALDNIRTSMSGAHRYNPYPQPPPGYQMPAEYPPPGYQMHGYPHQQPAEYSPPGYQMHSYPHQQPAYPHYQTHLSPRASFQPPPAHVEAEPYPAHHAEYVTVPSQEAQTSGVQYARQRARSPGRVRFVEQDPVVAHGDQDVKVSYIVPDEFAEHFSRQRGVSPGAVRYEEHGYPGGQRARSPGRVRYEEHGYPGGHPGGVQYVTAPDPRHYTEHAPNQVHHDYGPVTGPTRRGQRVDHNGNPTGHYVQRSGFAAEMPFEQVSAPAVQRAEMPSPVSNKGSPRQQVA